VDAREQRLAEGGRPNTVRKPIMLAMIEEHYGRTFQYQYAGTHAV